LRVVVGVVVDSKNNDDDEPIKKWFFNEDLGNGEKPHEQVN
jgi:hypothetical protein